MKPACICLIVILAASIFQTNANYYGKRDEKLDGFREFLSKRMGELNEQEIEARDVLRTISSLVQAWETRQRKYDTLQKAA